MTTHHIGRIVIGCLTAGLVVALALVLGPRRGRAGTRDYRHGPARVCVELGVAGDAIDPLDRRSLSDGRPCPPASWGWPALALLAFAPSGAVIDALGWVWPPLFLALLAATVVRVHRDLHSRTRLWVVYPLLSCLRAVRCRRRLSNHPGVARPPDVSGTRPVGRRRRTPASSELCRIRYSHRHPRIRPWRDWRLLGMDLDRGRTRHESVRLRPRGSRLERSGFCPAGRCRRGHGPPHPARSRARSGSLCARRPFVGRAVRQDLRRPVSRTGRGNGLARRPTGRSVRGPSRLSRPSTTVSAASPRCCRRWLDLAWGGWSTPTLQLACAARDMQRLHYSSARQSAACATSSPSCRRRLRRPVRFRASATARWSS